MRIEQRKKKVIATIKINKNIVWQTDNRKQREKRKTYAEVLKEILEMV